MSRMLAIVSRTAVPAELLMSFRRLADTGKTRRDFGCPQPNPKAGHPDGWGLVCVDGEAEIYLRSAAKASADARFEEAVRRVGRESNPPLLLLAHVRRAPVRDSIREEYAHPFRRELDGRVLFFCHNGGIEDFGIRDGRTDTQLIYEAFLEALGPVQRPLPELKQAIASAKSRLDAEWGKRVTSYSFLMLDGDRVIAHRDARTCVPYYTLHVAEGPDMTVVCSEVLPTIPGRWRMLRNGEFYETPRRS